MLDFMMDSSTLDNLLNDVAGVVGVVVGTTDGEVTATDGNVHDGDAIAAVAASLTGELGKIGAVLNLGELRVASLKSATAGRVFTRQEDAVIAIELDAKRPLGDLETKLRSMVWAAEDEFDVPGRNSGPVGRADSRPIPMPLPPPPAVSERLRRPTPSSITAERPARPTPTPAPLRTTQSSTRIPRVPTPPPMPVVPTRPTPVPATIQRAQIPLPPSRPSPVPAAVQQPAAPVSSGPVFSGDLEEFALPDLLEFLRNSHRTGVLSCTSPTGEGTVKLSRGMITGADSPNAIDLREYFLTNSELALDRRRALAALPHDYFNDDLIDETLGAQALVSIEEIEAARTARIFSAFREMIGWTRGRFSFDPSAPVGSHSLALSAQSVLMTIYQEQDEQDR